MGFEKVSWILEKIAATSKINEKIDIINFHADEPLFVKCVYYALDPYMTFKMAGDIKVQAYAPSGPADPHKIFYDLDKFSSVPALTKDQKGFFRSKVICMGKDCADVVNRILNKDLACGAKTAIFRKANKIFDQLPVFHPMKGEDDWPGFYKRSGGRKEICWSYKLDGTRTWAIANIQNQNCTYLSFNGHELQNFHCFDSALLTTAAELSKKEKLDKYIFDGEVVNIAGDFSKHMSEFRRLNNMDPSGFRFRIFDIFVQSTPFYSRYQTLKCLGLPPWHPKGAPFPAGFPEETINHFAYDPYTLDDTHLLTFLPHFPLRKNPEVLSREAVEIGLEGVMLKTWGHNYQEKRSWDWCKVKVFKSEDLKVVGKVKGRKKYAAVLGALVVIREGVEIEVGSGFSDAQRREFWNDMPSIIEVRYQEVLPSGSLRFPTFMRVRDDKE